MSIIKSFSVGDGDMFYIDHNSDNFTIIDCCMDDDSKVDIAAEIKTKSRKKGITRFITTHPDEDHIHGLKYLDDQITILNFYCVENAATKEDETDDFKHYCSLRDGQHAFYVIKGCTRRWMNLDDEVRKNSGINYLWPDTSDADFQDALSSVAEGSGFNNISPIFTYSVSNGVTVMWMGDMEHDFLEKIKDRIDWPSIDILFAPHHGRKTGKVSSDVLNLISPKIVVIGEAPSEHLDYYSDWNTLKQNSAGDIIFHSDGNRVHVFISEEKYSYDTSFLSDEGKSDGTYGYYLGSFTPKNADK